MLRTLFHPERYHGHRRRPPFFEGWYFKLVDPSGNHRLAIIPGIYLSHDPEHHHAFIQVLDGTTGNATYHRFPASEFEAARDAFDVRIGPNRFAGSGFTLEIGDENGGIAGTVRLIDPTPWPITVTAPGVMGPYGWIPMMECNHGVVSLDHGLAGSLTVDGTSIDFTGGRGYAEKDWGKSFPAGYVWMQSNHFSGGGTSFVGSIAIVPWLTSAFPGFIIGLWHDGRLHRFATYTNAQIDHLEITDDRVDWQVSEGARVLKIAAHRAHGGLLYGPTREQMGDRVGETMLSQIDISLSDGTGQVVFEGSGLHAGLELHGDLDRLLGMQVQ
jgi:tocopherol cyclase